MRWLTRNLLKVAIALVALLFLTVLVVVVPVAAAEAKPRVVTLMILLLPICDFDTLIPPHQSRSTHLVKHLSLPSKSHFHLRVIDYTREILRACLVNDHRARTKAEEPADMSELSLGLTYFRG